MNAVMIGDDLRGFADVVRLARRTRLIIWTNVIGTVAIDLFGIALAAAGFVTAPLAALVNASWGVACILYSATVTYHRFRSRPHGRTSSLTL
jgi:Cd2+/Zn2+-exporting ATPase/Cu+-exporting ATPase